jgi:hypothetical protein
LAWVRAGQKEKKRKKGVNGFKLIEIECFDEN